MQMTLAELRRDVLEWLDDPRGATFAPDGDHTRLDLLIAEAIDDLVQEIDVIPQPWAVEPDSESATRATITTVSTRREYEVPAGMRKVVQVTEPPTGIGEYRPITIVPYASRNNAAACGVYVFRSGTTGKWYVGLVSLPPAWTTLVIHGLPPVLKLTLESDVPYIIPDAFHSLVVRRAALLGKMQINREWRDVGMLWGEGIVKLRGVLGNLRQSYGARRF